MRRDIDDVISRFVTVVCANSHFVYTTKRKLHGDRRQEYSRTPVTRTLKGNGKQFDLAGVRVIGVD